MAVGSDSISAHTAQKLREGRPKIANGDELRDDSVNDPRTPCKSLATKFRISEDTIHTHLQDVRNDVYIHGCIQ